jgi:murein DD-endopeptidase MepM/ murein hydrolase activator NlpD
VHVPRSSRLPQRWTAGRVAALAFLLLMPAGMSEAADQDALPYGRGCSLPGLSVVEAKGRDESVLWVKADGLLEATLTLDVELHNAVASRALPLTMDLLGRRSVELVRITRKDPSRAWSFRWQWRWRPGGRHARHDPDVVYLLPYEPSSRFVVAQSRLGPFGHRPGSGFENAIDWSMPEGTRIRAARAGVVIATRGDSRLGGPGREFENCSNYVIVRHQDGTFASYMHLQPQGVLVGVGDYVQAGAPIGLSGNTGHSTGPHLHFDVFRNIDADRRETFAVPFATSEGSVVDLQMGRAY